MTQGVDENELPIKAARQGCEKAWGVLLSRFQLPLFAFVSELVNDSDLALDLIQETFIRAVKNINGLREETKVGAWLFGIAHRCCVDHWRKSGRRAKTFGPYKEIDENSAPDPSKGPYESLIADETGQEILDRLNELSLEHRTVMILHYLEDFTLADISDITGVELGTVKSRLHYAKKAMKSKLSNLKI